MSARGQVQRPARGTARERASERAYRLLLRAYPAAFRAAYGREMTSVFRHLRDEAGADAGRFWTEMIWDVAQSAPALRVDAVRAWWTRTTDQPQGGTMKPMAILAVLIGVLEAVNAFAEGWTGGVVHHDGTSLVAGTLAAIAGGVLVAAGIALLRRAPSAGSVARGGAITCLAAFGVAAAVAPRMSGFSTLLGIGFPVALLLFLRWTGGHRGGTPMPA